MLLFLKYLQDVVDGAQADLFDSAQTNNVQVNTRIDPTDINNEPSGKSVVSIKNHDRFPEQVQ